MKTRSWSVPKVIVIFQSGAQLCPEIPSHFETIKGIGLIGLGSLQIEKNHQFLDQKRRPGTVD
jgi:hypothetical protein